MEPRATTLENGLRVVSLHMPHVETVSVSVWADVGSRYETLKNNGISHFLEHMAFKGTERRTARDIAEEFDNIGGNLNAYTSRERTVYYAKVLKNDIDRAVDVLGDILQNSTFDTEELQRERDVVLQEIAQCDDTPDDIIFDYYQETAYPNQPIGRSILGTKELVSQFNDTHLREYIANFYTGENIVLAAAGNINHEHFVSLARQHFSKLPKQAVSRAEKASYLGSDTRHQRDLEQIHLIMGFEGYSYYAPEYYTQQVLAILLGGGLSSRLFQEIREVRGLAYSISSFTSCYRDTALFSIYSGTSENQANELIAVTCDELLKATHTITEEELQRAKTQVRAALCMSKESTTSMAEELGSHFTIHGRHLSTEEIIEKINNVSVTNIQDVMKNILTKSQPTLASIGNIRNLESYETTAKRLIL